MVKQAIKLYVLKGFIHEQKHGDHRSPIINQGSELDPHNQPPCHRCAKRVPRIWLETAQETVASSDEVLPEARPSSVMVKGSWLINMLFIGWSTHGRID